MVLHTLSRQYEWWGASSLGGVRLSSKRLSRRRKEIAGRLLLLRERKYGNASEMARSVNLTPQAWYNYETGRRALDVDVAAIVIEEHGVDFNWLYGGDAGHLPRKVKLLLFGNPKQPKPVSIKPRRKSTRSAAKPKDSETGNGASAGE